MTCLAVLLIGCEKEQQKPIDLSKAKLRKAEEIIDAFYTFDRKWLERLLISAPESIPKLSFYQGWAEGGNYRVINRTPCRFKNHNTVSCSIMVEDDLMKALEIDYHVTDTFIFVYVDAKIQSIETSSNDLEVYWQARKWLEDNHPKMIEISCQGIWGDGPTPIDCIRDMVAGYKLFRASEEFPSEAEIAQMILENQSKH